MSKKIPLIVGELKFSTQKEAHEYFKKKLNSYQDHDDVSIDDYEILIHLIERHPEAIQKIGEGIKRFFKAPAPEMNTSPRSPAINLSLLPKFFCNPKILLPASAPTK